MDAPRIEVGGQGPENARIALVGEAPSVDEIREGFPFAGAAGRLLNKALFSADLRREDVYVTNVVKRFIKDSVAFRKEMYEGSRPTEELLAYRQDLFGELSSRGPNIVVCLGGEAWKAFTGHSGMTEWRGSLLFHDEMACKVLATVHPAFILRGQSKYYPLLVFDLVKAKRESDAKAYIFPTRDLHLNITLEELDSMAKRIYYMKPAEKLAFDIETNEKTGELSCASFALDKDTAYSADLSSGDNISEKLARLKVILESPCTKVFQNAQYDVPILERLYNIHVKNIQYDTMVMFNLVYPEVPKGLATLSSIYTNVPYYKDIPKRFKGDAREFWKYNALDSCIAYECCEAILKELKEERLEEFYTRNVVPLIRIFVDMQILGTRIDQEERRKIRAELDRERATAQAELDAIVGRPLNVKSSKDVPELLYQQLHLPIKYHRKTKMVTTDDTTLRDLARHYPEIKELQLIRKIRDIRKDIETYLDCPIDEDGRIRCTYILGGTETGRIASHESAFRTGTNLQNVPRDGPIRRMFIPDEGFLFLQADLNQAEARVVAQLSGEQILITLLDNQGDVHREVASFIFGKSSTEITYPERTLAKRLVHASNYGMGARKFSDITELPESRSKMLLNLYHSRFPKIRLWHETLRTTVTENRLLHNLFGRRRIFYGILGEELFREAFAYIPQSTVADYLNIGLIATSRELRERVPESKLMLHVHDSFVVQCQEKDLEEVGSIVKGCLDIPLSFNGKTFSIPVNLSVGENWADLHRV